MSKPFTIEQELQAAQTQLVEFEAVKTELAAANTKISELEQAVVQLSQDAMDATAEVALLKEEVARVNGEFEKAKSRVAVLEAAEQDIEKRATAKAIEMTASQGVPAVKLPGINVEGATGTKTGESVIEKLEAINDPMERAKFRHENAAAIAKEIESLKKSKTPNNNK